MDVVARRHRIAQLDGGDPVFLEDEVRGVPEEGDLEMDLPPFFRNGIAPDDDVGHVCRKHGLNIHDAAVDDSDDAPL